MKNQTARNRCFRELQMTRHKKEKGHEHGKRDLVYWDRAW